MKPERIEELLRDRPPDEPAYHGVLDLENDASLSRTRRVSRGLLAASVAGTAVAALVIGLLLGQVLNNPPGALSSSPSPSATPAPSWQGVVPSKTASVAPTAAPTPLPPGPDVAFAGLLSSTDGWALTSTGLSVTSDGGTSWQARTVPGPTTDRGVLGVAFQDARHGWLATLDSADPNATVFDVWRTSDGGRTWSKAVLTQRTNVAETMGAVQFVLPDASHLFAMVGGGMPNGYASDLYESTDGGATWSADRVTGGGITGELSFADASHGVIAGGGSGDHLFGTHDAGALWQPLTVQVQGGTQEQPTGFFAGPTFWDASTGALTVNYGDASGPTAFGILVTGDAGQTWRLASRIPLTPTQSNAVPVAFLSPTDWRAFPDGHTLVVTADAGQTWASHTVAGLPTVPLDVSFADAAHGWARVSLAVCLSGKSECSSRTGLYATNDGGESWVALAPGGAQTH